MEEIFEEAIELAEKHGIDVPELGDAFKPRAGKRQQKLSQRLMDHFVDAPTPPEPSSDTVKQHLTKLLKSVIEHPVRL